MPNTTYNDFVKDPDQAARRAELAAFCGPRPDKFVKIYDKMAQQANPQPGIKPQFSFFDSGFCWPAFFLGPIWMMYRKMWLWGGVILVAFVIFSFLPLPRGVGIGLSVGMAVGGARLYVYNAIGTIAKLRDNPPALAAASGVSHLAGWTTGILYIVIVGYFAFHTANLNRSQTLGGPSGTYSSPR